MPRGGPFRRVSAHTRAGGRRPVTAPDEDELDRKTDVERDEVGLTEGDE
jgi:hypothetical protein